MDVLLATNNEGKIARFRRLIQHVDPAIRLCTAAECGIPAQDVNENGATLADNAELKVRAYGGLVSIPILANDTGFSVEGEGFISTPKRTALGGVDERTMTPAEIAQQMLTYWKDIAIKHGGRVDAASVEAFAVLYPDGELRSAEARREWILTDQEFGEFNQAMPARSLYISKATNKPANLHSEAEEVAEMAPVLDALRSVLRR